MERRTVDKVDDDHHPEVARVFPVDLQNAVYKGSMERKGITQRCCVIRLFACGLERIIRLFE